MLELWAAFLKVGILNEFYWYGEAPKFLQAFLHRFHNVPKMLLRNFYEKITPWTRQQKNVPHCQPGLLA
jgi:hypothetical protein